MVFMITTSCRCVCDWFSYDNHDKHDKHDNHDKHVDKHDNHVDDGKPLQPAVGVCDWFSAPPSTVSHLNLDQLHFDRVYEDVSS